MKKIIAFLASSLFLLASHSYAATQTINTVPDANANFVSTLQNFLRQEAAERSQLRTPSFNIIISGGTASTSGTLSHTIAAAIGFPNGYYVSQPSVSHTYTATKDTYVFIRDDTSRAVTITDFTITYDDNLVFATYDSGVGSSTPTTPTGCLALFKAVTNGTSITSVTDLRTTDSGYLTASDDWTITGDNTFLGPATFRDVTIGTTRRVSTEAGLIEALTDASVTSIYAEGLITLTADRAITKPFDAPSMQVFTGAFNITGLDFARPEWWGAVGDGVTDDSDAIQSAINAMSSSGGGTVQLLDKIYKANIELASYVTIRGMAPVSYPSKVAGVAIHYKSTLLANAAGSVLTSPATKIVDVTIENLSILGLGAGTSVKGIYLDDCDRGTFRNLSFDNLADQAIRIDEGLANEFIKIFAQNCLLNRTRAAKIGVMDIGAGSTDNFFDRCEITASSTSISDANLYICAWNFSGSTNFITNCIGEISDVGFYVAGYWNKFSNCRADLNFAHGYQVASGAGANQFISCAAHRNSRGGDNTYDGYNVVGANNIFIGCLSDSLVTDAWQQRYGFYDADNSNTTRSIYVGVAGTGNQTALFYGDSYLGAGLTSSVPNMFIFTDNDATPSVSPFGLPGSFFLVNYSSNTTITDFDDGTPGQTIQILKTGGVGTVTLDHGDNIKINTGADKDMVVEKIYTFRSWNGVWYEVE